MGKSTINKHVQSQTVNLLESLYKSPDYGLCMGYEVQALKKHPKKTIEAR